jgi:hypothetical protein
MQADEVWYLQALPFPGGKIMSPNRIVGGYQLLAQIKGYGSGSSRLRAAAPCAPLAAAPHEMILKLPIGPS